MHSKTYSSLLVLLAAESSATYAGEDAIPQLDTLVVTATRSEKPLRETGSTVSIITHEDIAKRQVLSVADALRIVPGLDVVNSGGPGQATSVFLRGANATQTLVLIDGIEMNDPSSPGNAFDFANLMVDNIERIEVLRGGESSIYGSDAIGGVVNIITKKGAKAPSYSVQGQGGSYNTFKVGGAASGGTDLLDYSLSASRTETQGFSAADRRRGNPERDGYRNSTVDTRIGIHPAENVDFGWSLRFNEGKTYLDSDYPTPHDDPNYTSINKELYTRGFSHFKVLDDLWEQTIGVSYSRTDRRYVDMPDPVNPYTFPADYLGEKVKVDWQNILHLHEANTLTIGIENEDDRLSSESSPIGSKSYNTQGYYMLDQIQLWERWFTTAAVRFDDNNRVGSKVTWRITQALVFDETGTKLRGNYGTGFKMPSLIDLFDQYVGNPALSPETSKNWDIGIEQVFWDQRANVGATYFNNRFDNLIQYSFADRKVENLARATAEGVETFIQVTPLQDLSFRGTYTYTHSENLATDQRLLRRPTHKGTFESNYRFVTNADVNLTVLAVGDRDDIYEKRLASYVVVNLATGYRINESIRLFARIENIFDKDYQQIYGYGSSRIAGYGGVSLTF